MCVRSLYYPHGYSVGLLEYFKLPGVCVFLVCASYKVLQLHFKGFNLVRFWSLIFWWPTVLFQCCTINKQEYTRWRGSGLAFEMREGIYQVPNPSLLSFRVFSQVSAVILFSKSYFFTHKGTWLRPHVYRAETKWLWEATGVTSFLVPTFPLA